MTLLRRLERLEAALGAKDDVSHPEIVAWSYRRPPYDAATQKNFDNFARRCENSRLCRLILEAYSGMTVEPPARLEFGQQLH
jgi:hypothetical protein